MKKILFGLISVLLFLPLAGEERKTIYVDRMEGLEAFVEKALQDAELPFDFIEEKEKPEMKANLKKMHSAYGEILYRHKFGRNETHWLELRDVEKNKVIASHSFALKADDESRKQAAEAFAAKVREAMAKKPSR
jgi:hypothetical protein